MVGSCDSSLDHVTRSCDRYCTCMMQAKQILEKIEQRELYKCLGQTQMARKIDRVCECCNGTCL